MFKFSHKGTISRPRRYHSKDILAVRVADNPADFTHDDAFNLGQKTVGYTDALSQRPVLTSFGAATCIIIAIYNPATKEAALAHFDSNSSPKSLAEIFEKLSPGGKENLDIHLAGGSKLAEDVLDNVLKVINRKKNAVIKSSKLMQEHDKLAIDARSGKPIYDFDLKQIDHSARYWPASEKVEFEKGQQDLKTILDLRKSSKKPINVHRIGKAMDSSGEYYADFYARIGRKSRRRTGNIHNKKPSF